MAGLSGIKVAMLGGDERELILTRALLAEGARVFAVGYPKSLDLGGLVHLDSVVEAVAAADVVVAPMSNTDERGVVKSQLESGTHIHLDEEAFRAMGAGKTLFIGIAKPVIEELAARFHVRLIQTAEIDEVAILNSIPTAEGAIFRAMQELPVTIHGSRTVVVGYGRCGITLARMLQGIGARVRVVAREGGQLARAHEAGLQVDRLEALGAAVEDARIVFNTVPARVITRETLKRMRKDAVVIDIASAPGGTDFAAARELGVKAMLELGLPGRMAPQSAGEILARTLPPLIRAECGI